MALVVTGGLATSPAASADPISSCTASTGTVVAVDFGHWGGPVVRGCGVDSSSGYLLLHDGGFTTAGDAHDGPAFICRIGNAAFGGGAQYPTSKDDACIKTPSASAYWSFWLAPKGQDTWSYSQLGAMSDKPEPGEVELWHFGGTDVAGTSGRPTISPAALRATGARAAGGGGAGSSSKPTHGGSSRTTARAGGGVATSPRSAGVRAGTGARSAGSASATGSHTAAPTSASRGVVTPAPSSGVTAAGSSSVASASPPIVDASAVAGSGTSSSAGSPWPVILGVALVLLLGGAGGLGVLRRRRADAAEH